MKEFTDYNVYRRSTCDAPLISVAIAVYNMGFNGYLKEFLGSIDALEPASVEFVLCDDASTDNSVEIAKEWVDRRNDATLLVMDENRKQGGARNRCIAEARGQYVAIVDPDDMVSSNFFCEMEKAALQTRADALIPEYIQRVDGRGVGLGAPFKNAPDEAIFDAENPNRIRIAILDHWTSGAWKRAFFEDDSNLYPEGMAYEDTPQLIRLILQSGAFALVPDITYLYRVNLKSTTHSTHLDNKLMLDRVTSSDLIISNAKDLGVYDKYREEIDYYYYQVGYRNTLMSCGRNKTWRRGVRGFRSRALSQVPHMPRNPYFKKKEGLVGRLIYYCPRLALRLWDARSRLKGNER